MSKVKNIRRKKIKMRIRKTINGSSESPRLSVFRSNKEIYAQLVDDDKEVVLLAASSLKLNKEGKTKTEIAAEVGAALAKAAVEAGISTVVFDRGGYLYHGRVKALADSARENGLKF